MGNLLKADFRRVFKDKLTLVLGILAVVFALFTPLLYLLIVAATGELGDSVISSLVTAKAQFFGSFSITNNLGIIAPVLLVIALWKDFSYGTVRNKIIAGKSRAAIFFSMFITCSAALIAVILLHALVTLGISLIFFDYQEKAFAFSDLLYLLESLAYELLVFLFVASVLSWLCAAMKNIGLVIVLYIAFTFLLAIVASICQVGIAVLELVEDSESIVSALKFIDRINIGNAGRYIGVGDSYTLEDRLFLTIPAITGILMCTSFGLVSFNKKDLK